jgi:spoIIIJ-associated protein
MESTPVSSPAPTSTPRDPREVLQTMLNGLGLEATVERQDCENHVRLHISTAEPGRLIGRHGQTLSQLQFLVNRILLRADPNAPRVQIDCENYRHRQRDDVLAKVREAAEKVRRWGEPVEVGPLGPTDRRAIQEHFAADPEIEAVCESGDDAGLKKLTLRLKPSASS